jgi:hypothetical protein
MKAWKLGTVAILCALAGCIMAEGVFLRTVFEGTIFGEQEALNDQRAT